MSPDGRPRLPWWAWPSLLVIDAPVVAVAWAWALARATGAPFGGVEAAAVGLGTAAVYLFDRARDAARLQGAGDERPPTQRHAFAARHLRGMVTAAIVASLATLALVPWLAPAAIRWGVGVAIVAAPVVLAARRGRQGVAAWRPLAVGVIFAAGAATPAAAGPMAGLDMLPVVAGLAAVAALNVAMIAGWEADLNDGASPRPASPPTPRGSVRRPVLRSVLRSSLRAATAWRGSHRGAGWPRVGLGVGIAIGAFAARPWMAGLGSALVVAAAALALLEAAAIATGPRSGSVAHPETWHVAADAALLIALTALPLG